jgi:hypothetical protein
VKPSEFSMSQKPRPSRLHRARRAVIATIVSFACVNFGMGAAAELYPRIRDPFYGDKFVKLRRQQRTNRDAVSVVNVVNVVMLGTSRTGFGFHGQLVEQLCASEDVTVQAFNFGIPASGPVLHLLYTQRLIRDGVAPNILLIELLPSMYAKHRGGFETHWLNGERLQHHELAVANQFGFDRTKLAREWRTTTMLPWHGLRFQLLGRVVSSWIPWQIRYDWSRGTDAWGWGTPVRNSVTAAEHTRLLANARAEYEPVLHDWELNPHSAAALRELLSLCRRHTIEPIVVMMPEGSQFRSWYPPAAHQRIDSFVRALRRECRVVNAQDWLPDDAFYDDHHQFRHGAETFTKRLTHEAILPAILPTIRGQNR